MELIHYNPYRIAGILSNATERELQKQKTKIKAYSKVGKEIKSDYDFQILSTLTRTENSIDKAFSSVEQNQDKVRYALFWFLNTSPVDKIAFDYLKSENEGKAIEQWEKVTLNKDVNSKNFSAFNNLGTYKLLSQSQDDIKAGIEAKIKLIESEYFENFVHLVADKTFTIDNEKQIGKFVDELIDQLRGKDFYNNIKPSHISTQNLDNEKKVAVANIVKNFYEEIVKYENKQPTFEEMINHLIKYNGKDQMRSLYKGYRVGWENNGYPETNFKEVYNKIFPKKKEAQTLEIFSLFSNCSGSTQKYLSRKLTEEPIHKIETQIESCKKKRKNNKSGAYEIGLKLYANTKEDLSLLKSLLGTNDLKYKAVADQLANEIMQCGIDYFNQSQENDSSDDFLKQAQELNKTALSIAVGKLTKDRAKDSLATLEEMKDREVAQAITLLQSVKDAYETNEANIRRQIKELKENDIELKFGIKTINQSAVEDNIKNSIDWSKVNDLLKEILPNESLERIKASSNSQLKSEFTELANWLKEYSQSSSLIRRIIDNYKKIPPKLSFKIISSEITNTDNKPLFTKFIRYLGLNLKVEASADSEVTFYLKYINTKGRVDRNSKSSPIGYTKLEKITMYKNSNEITFSGWGSSKECTYELGEHRIEVYVDEYLIHTKKYTVDLAPSEKLEKEITTAEKNLKLIKQSNYFSSEIKAAQIEMSEIQKFKLFRGSSEKRNQIQSQQTKIDNLIKKSRDVKNMNIRTHEEKIYKLKMELSEAKY